MRAVLIVLMSLGLAMAGCKRNSGGGGATSQIQELTIASGGTDLYVRTVGAGPPVLVLHDGPGLGFHYLYPHLYPLSRDHRLIFYDQRCAGRSECGNSLRLEDFMADIEAIRLHFGYDQLHLLGHGFGGLLAMQYAIRDPGKIRSLILASPHGGSSEYRSEENVRIARRMDEGQMSVIDSIQNSADFAAGSAAAYGEFLREILRPEFYDKEKADDIDWELAPEFAQRSAQVQEIYQDLASYDIHAALTTVTAPVLILYGEYEPMQEIAAPRLLSAFPNATLTLLPKAGNFTFMEANEQFSSAVNAFIDNCQP